MWIHSERGTYLRIRFYNEIEEYFINQSIIWFYLVKYNFETQLRSIIYFFVDNDSVSFVKTRDMKIRSLCKKAESFKKSLSFWHSDFFIFKVRLERRTKFASQFKFLIKRKGLHSPQFRKKNGFNLILVESMLNFSMGQLIEKPRERESDTFLIRKINVRKMTLMKNDRLRKIIGDRFNRRISKVGLIRN